MIFIEKIKTEVNYKINIDKNKNKYYNKTEIEIFTYKEHLLYENFINNSSNKFNIKR